MTIEQLQKKYDNLFGKIKSYRHWQKQVDEYHLESDRQPIKMLARELDGLIRREVEEMKSKLV